MAGLTASEMMYEVKVLYESIHSSAAPGFTPREWSVLLTQAQEKVVLGLCPQLDKDSFTRIKLASLINYGVITTGASIVSAVAITGYANSCRVSLTSLNETVQGYIYKPLFYYEQRGTTSTLTNVKIMEETEDYIWQNLENPYKNPGKYGFWQLPYKDESVIVITSGGLLTHYYTAYVKKPYPIIVPWASYTTAMTLEGYNLSSGTNPDGGSVKTAGVNCRLHESLHREIVREAALLAKATNKDQIAVQLQKMQENS